MHDGVQRVDGEVVVRVSLPSRPYSGNRLEKDQATFRKEFQEVQEGLVSLAAVAYIDYPAYRYLISDHVGVMLGNPGEELFAAVVKVKFILWVDEEGRVGKNEDGTVEYDLTQFCGPQQFEHSDKFIKALNQIAAFDEKLGQSDAVITIPVKVNFQVLVGTGNNYARSLLDIKEAEQAIKARRSSYVHNEKGANENLSFRFVLEPMILDICCADMTLEMVKSVETLMLANVWFTEIALNVWIFIWKMSLLRCKLPNSS
ncbi:hypothetical protein PR002_g3225 [Phytophthora rubi]|nr:hypothetical protein PR002_g3225 [Phytophthora rubi]